MRKVFFKQKSSRLKALHQILISVSYFGDARFSEDHFIIYIYDFGDIYVGKEISNPTYAVLFSSSLYLVLATADHASST